MAPLDDQVDTDEDDDHLGGCELSPDEIEDEETAELRQLFPEGADTPGLGELADAYNALGALDA